MVVDGYTWTRMPGTTLEVRALTDKPLALRYRPRAYGYVLNWQPAGGLAAAAVLIWTAIGNAHPVEDHLPGVGVSVRTGSPAANGSRVGRRGRSVVGRRQRRRGLSRLEGPVDGRPGYREQIGEVRDGVLAGGVHAAQLGLLLGGEFGLAAA